MKKCIITGLLGIFAMFSFYCTFEGNDKTSSKVTNEDKLDGRLLVQQDQNGYVSIWNASTRKNLTYCVSNDFNAYNTSSYNIKNLVIEALDKASRQWERAIDVDFIYVPSQDANCSSTSRNYNVLFNVVPAEAKGVKIDFVANSIFPTTPSDKRFLYLSTNALLQRFLPQYFSTTTGFYNSYIGVIAHELGHLLGFRHEFNNQVNGTGCTEDFNWIQYSIFDMYSIMQYDSENYCNWANMKYNDISFFDALAARKLYPAKQYPLVFVDTDITRILAFDSYGMVSKARYELSGRMLDDKQVTNVQVRLYYMAAYGPCSTYPVQVHNAALYGKNAWHAEIDINEGYLFLCKTEIAAYDADGNSTILEPTQYVYKGNQTTYSLPKHASPDILPLASTVSGTVTLKPNMDSATQAKINSVVLFIDGVYKDRKSAPFEFLVDTSKYENGSHVVKLMFNSNSPATYNPYPAYRIYTINNSIQKPVISMTTPHDNRNVMGDLFISASCNLDSNCSTINRVDFFLNNTLIYQSYAPPFEIKLNTKTYSNGTYTLKMNAWDKNGNFITESKTIVIDNTKPVITITSPENDWVTDFDSHWSGQPELTVDMRVTENFNLHRLALIMDDNNDRNDFIIENYSFSNAFIFEEYLYTLDTKTINVSQSWYLYGCEIACKSRVGYSDDKIINYLKVMATDYAGNTFWVKPISIIRFPEKIKTLVQVKNESIAQGAYKYYGPYAAKAGTTFYAIITGNGGDADIYTRYSAWPATTAGSWNCRPYANHSNEVCTLNIPSGSTQNVYVMVNGYQNSTYTLTVNYSN